MSEVGERPIHASWHSRHSVSIDLSPVKLAPQTLDVLVNSHALRPLRKLGEGGYAFVYLVKEVPSSTVPAPDTTTRYGLKKVLASSQERLEAAQREIMIQQQACHPCLLPLLDWCVVPPSPTDPSASHTVYMLSPAYPDGTLADELARLGAVRSKASKAKIQVVQGGGLQGEQQQGSVSCVLSTQQVLVVFRQLCLALESLHSKGYAHRDVKTHNILIRRPRSSTVASSGSPTAPGQLTGIWSCSRSFQQPAVSTWSNPQLNATAPIAPTTPTASTESVRSLFSQQKETTAGASLAHAYGMRHGALSNDGTSHTPRASQAGGQGSTFLFPTRSSTPGTAATAPIDAKDVLAAGRQQQGYDVEMCVDGLDDAPHVYGAVLMDFGSAGPRRLDIATRGDALRLQEDAEANCTATFRAPELWDVPSPCTLDQGAVDVWAAGCTLYAAMYGQSPFQISLNQGGSLALAVLNCSIPWPKDPDACYPAQLHDLVMQCLAADPAQRPSATELVAAVAALMAAQPALPDPALFTRHARIL